MNKKRKPYDKEHGRNYEYDKKYESTEEQKERRARRNRDRRRAIATHGKEALKDKDIHHQDSEHMTKPKVMDRSKNRAKH